MERRIEEEVDGWPSRPFDGGVAGLRNLADGDFSGAVRAAGTWLFLVNGRVVGVFDGDLEDVEDSGGTVYRAPHPSLPLLYAMQTIGGETRAKYYTNDTPISEVHETLSSGFTGYVELSENVLSGDYYQLYHAGRSMSVAFVGNSGRMITGDEAFERADDEVGIYEVVDVELEVRDLPSPPSTDAGDDRAPERPQAAAEGSAGGSSASAGPGGPASEAEPTGDDAAEPSPHDGEPSSPDGPDGIGGTDGPEPREATDVRGEDAGPPPGRSDAGGADGATRAGDRHAREGPDGTEASPGDSSEASDAPRGDAPHSSPDQPDEDPTAAGRSRDARGTDGGGDASEADRGAEASRAERGGASETNRGAEAGRADRGGDASQTDRGAEAGPSETATRTDRAPGAADSAGTDSGTREPDAGSASAEPDPPEESTDGDGRYQSEAAWREATTVPSLDPEQSSEPDADGAGSSHEAASGEGARTETASGEAAGASAGRSESQRRASPAAAERGAEEMSGTFEQEVLEREDRIDRLQQRISNLEAERDELARERDELAARVEQLEADNASLESELAAAERELEALEGGASETDIASGAAPASGPDLAPRTALESTDLFVRYDAKSEPTLDDVHGGGAQKGNVDENLRLDVHTQFEDAGATVEGQPFEAYLRETMAFRFVEWLVRDLPYEIRDTGSASQLRDLYDALPRVDRVEFHGTVAREATEDDEGAPGDTFDVVVRDKLGDALFVANMNETREPATSEMIVELQEGASRVKEHSGALAAAFFVTRSFFDPEALETADAATSASLLSRDSRKSFVKLSRKRGYHLCLVEARGEDLHLNAPEL